MNGLRVGDYAVEEILYEDGNLVYARGTRAGSPDVLVCLMADRVVKDARGPVERSERDAVVPPPVELEYLPRGAEASCQGILPLLALGTTTGWTALVYPFVRALPLALHLKSIPTLRRGEALGYALAAATAVAELHRVGLISTDVHLGNVLVDEADAVHLPYNRNLGPERHRDVLKAHPQVKRFDVVAPEQVWGNGPGQGTDIFQIGALLVAGLTRRLLVLSPDVAHRDFQAALSGIYPPADYFEAVPKPFDAFVARAMSPDPPDRHEDIEAALVELRELLDKVRITDAVSEVVRQGFVRKGADESSSARVPPPAARTEVPSEGAPGAEDGGAVESPPAEKRPEPRSRPAPPGSPRRGRPSSPTSVPAEGSLVDRLRERLGPAGLSAALGGAGLLAVLIPILVLGGGEEDPPRATATPRPTRAPTEAPTERPTVAPPTVTATKPTATAVIDVRELMPSINSARARPTDLTTFTDRKKLLQKCYLALPREHRGKAIPSSIFQQLFELNRGDRTKAYQLMDQTFEKFETYLRENNAQM